MPYIDAPFVNKLRSIMTGVNANSFVLNVVLHFPIFGWIIGLIQQI